MRRFFLFISLIAGLLMPNLRVSAFSLLGEIPAWFVPETGLFPNGVDIYGPMNLGEEYRWNVPVINYAFDESFLNYFGQRGVEEVEKAIKILNDLPRMSQINLSDYPLHSMRVHPRASDLRMLDIKSYALRVLLEEMGLGSPTRYAFTLRVREVQATPPLTNYLVVQRNFDPETWSPTPYINGQLWTYNDIFDVADSPTIRATTLMEPVDPLILAQPVAGLEEGLTYTSFTLGAYFTGLTRDDVGGLRYIYRPDNRNVDTLPVDAFGLAGVGVVGGGGGGEWTPIPAPSTNTTGSDPNGGGGVVVTTNGIFFAQALRNGPDKITFVRTPALIQTGGYAVTNRFTEVVTAVITNGVQRTLSQRVTRILAAPDITFSAEDLTADPEARILSVSRTDIAINNNALNGRATLDGPGQLTGPTDVVFNKVGPSTVNIYPFFLGQPAQGTEFIWGSFDGTTNDPVVYPVGSTIRDAERRVFGSR